MAQKKPLLFLGGLWALVDVLRFACKLVDGKAGFVIGSAPLLNFPRDSRAISFSSADSLELVLKVHILLQFQNFGCKTFRFRRVTFQVALLNLHVFRSKF